MEFWTSVSRINTVFSLKDWIVVMFSASYLGWLWWVCNLNPMLLALGLLIIAYLWSKLYFIWQEHHAIPADNLAFNTSSQLRQVWKKTYSNQTVPLDGIEYIECVFQNVTLLYEEKAVCRMTGCTIAEGANVAVASSNPLVKQTILILQSISRHPTFKNEVSIEEKV